MTGSTSSVRSPDSGLLRVRAAIFGLRLISLLPWWGQRIIGQTIGALAQRWVPKRIGIARQNLTRVYPEMSEADRDELLSAHCGELGIGVLQAGMAWWASDARSIALTDIEGLRHLQAVDSGPILFAGIHCTAMELLLRTLGTCTDISAVHRPFGHQVFDEIVLRGRGRATRQMISKHEPRALIHAMQNHERVYIAADQMDTTSGAVPSVFLGQETVSNATLVRLAAKYAATVLPVHMVRDGARYRLTIYPPLELSGEDRSADVAILNRAFETMIAAAPSQYYWVHRRFRDTD